MTKRVQKQFIEPTIPSEFVFDALQASIFLGVDVDSILIDAGLEPTQLKMSGQVISVVDYARLIKRIIAKLDDGFLGFLDDKIPVKSFSVFAAQLAACENLKQLFQQVNRFYGLFSKQFILSIEEANDNAIIVLNFKETQDFDYRFIYQSILLAIIRLMHWFIGENIRPRQVKFTFEESHLNKYLNYLFDCPLAYDHTKNEIHIERSLLTTPCSTNLKQVNEMLRESTRMMLISDKPAPFTRRVRKELVLKRNEHWPSIEEVADAINLSKNLLWRKLKKENTTFLDIRDEVKRDVALSLMSNHELSVSDVSTKTGFSDVSSFNKAFTKWTGQSPSIYRKSLINRL